jgi:hypothetical protein
MQINRRNVAECRLILNPRKSYAARASNISIGILRAPSGRTRRAK